MKVDTALLDRAKHATGILEDDSLLEEALKILIRHEASQRLIRLGGSSPDFEAPPRRRFDDE